MFHDRGARVRQIRPTQLLLSVFCALSLLTSHAQPSGAPSLGAASADELSPVVERKLGEAIMVEGRRDPDFIDDPAINQYLNDVAHRLVVWSCRPNQKPSWPVYSPMKRRTWFNAIWLAA